MVLKQNSWGNILQLICLIGIKDDHLIGYKKTILERQSFSEVNTALLRFDLQKCHKKNIKTKESKWWNNLRKMFSIIILWRLLTSHYLHCVRPSNDSENWQNLCAHGTKSKIIIGSPWSWVRDDCIKIRHYSASLPVDFANCSCVKTASMFNGIYRL